MSRYPLFWMPLICALAVGVPNIFLLAAERSGHSLIGICKDDYACAKAHALFREQSVIRYGLLGTTFSPRCKCHQRLLRDPRPKVIRVHATNGPCLRNGRCGRYEPFHGETIASAEKKLRRGNRKLLRKVERAVRRVASYVPDRPDLTCFCSAVLETNFSAGVRRKLGQLCAKHAPHCKVVDNPMRGPCVKGMVCEIHGSTPRLTPPCIADIDGEVGFNARAFHARYRRCEMSLEWYPKYNCFDRLPPPFVDPRRRDCGRAWR